MPPPTETEHERLMFDEWATKGEYTPLLALADYVDEFQSERTHFSTLLREVAAAANPAVQWFYNSSPVVCNPKFETERHGRLREAACLAWCEANLFAKIDAKLWRCRWERDHFDYVGDELDPDGPVLWRIWIEENQYRNIIGDRPAGSWKLLNALGAIELEPVVAEMGEYRGDLGGLRIAYSDGQYGMPMFDMDGKLNSKEIYSPYSRVMQAVLSGPKTEVLEWMKPQRDPPASELVEFRNYQGVCLALLPEVPSCIERTTDLCVAYQAVREKSIYRLRECDVPYDEIVRLSKHWTKGLECEEVTALTGLMLVERNIRAVPLTVGKVPKDAAKKRARRRAEIFNQ